MAKRLAVAATKRPSRVPWLHPPTLQHRAEHRALGDAAGGKPGLDGLDCLAQSASIT